MQRLRNNFHPARKHTQKISRDIRKLRAQWRRDYYEKEPSPATLRAMEEVRRYEEFLKAWEKSEEAYSVD